ncbi:MAG: class I SAM-dependent methyltransferase [Bacteroidales bacterium]
MRNDFWNERYAIENYAYGTAPNRFFKSELDKTPIGKILFPAEGEGRNAVYAARKGFDVYAFDPSLEGRKKAIMLAETNAVTIDYQLVTYEEAQYAENSFDVLVLIFCHMPPSKREAYHRKLISFLKPGGKLILEGFSKEQIHNQTGGPSDVDMLFSVDVLRSDFSSLSEISVSKENAMLEEGLFHKGKASVIRVVGVK